jgi:hypothetical protein
MAAKIQFEILRYTPEGKMRKRIRIKLNKKLKNGYKI